MTDRAIFKKPNRSTQALNPAHPSNAVPQPPTLRCTRCRDVFEPPFCEFFYRDWNGPFGWRKWCKACYSEAPSIVRRRAKEIAC